jgi:hypothetical protein
VAVVGWAVILSAGLARSEAAAPPVRPASEAELLAAVKALEAPRVAWRQIAWKSCLLDGLRESRASNKPVLLWVFIDRPADDARC